MSKHDKESYDYLTWLAEDHKKRSKLDKAPKRPKYVRPVHEIDIEDEYVDEHDIYKD